MSIWDILVMFSVSLDLELLDDKITILDSGDKWDKVATEDGVIGYIAATSVNA